MTRPQLSDLITLGEDVGTKLLDSKWTPRVIGVLAIGALGFLIGVEAVRAAIG